MELLNSHSCNARSLLIHRRKIDEKSVLSPATRIVTGKKGDADAFDRAKAEAEGIDGPYTLSLQLQSSKRQD